jgi:hypothetical protein
METCFPQASSDTSHGCTDCRTVNLQGSARPVWRCHFYGFAHKRVSIQLFKLPRNASELISSPYAYRNHHKKCDNFRATVELWYSGLRWGNSLTKQWRKLYLTLLQKTSAHFFKIMRLTITFPLLYTICVNRINACKLAQADTTQSV